MIFFVKICSHIQQDHVVSGTIVESIPSLKKSQYKYEFVFNGQIHYYYHDAMYFIPQNGSKSILYLKVKNSKIEGVSLLTLKLWEIAILLLAILMVLGVLDDAAYRYPKPNDRYWNKSMPRYVLSFLLFVLCTNEALIFGEKYYFLRDAQFVEGVVTKKGTSNSLPEVQFAYNGAVHIVPPKKITFINSAKSIPIYRLTFLVHSRLSNQLGQPKMVAFIKIADPVLYDFSFWLVDFLNVVMIVLFAYFYWVGHKKNWRWRKQRRR
jgi:hypothetical protein